MKTKTAVIAATVATPTVFFIFNRFALLFTSTSGNSVTRLVATAQGLWTSIYSAPFSLGFTPSCLVVGACGVGFVWLGVVWTLGNRTNYMYGTEHGSARWGVPADIKPYMDKEPQRNILLTETESLTMAQRNNQNQSEKEKTPCQAR